MDIIDALLNNRLFSLVKHPNTNNPNNPNTNNPNMGGPNPNTNNEYPHPPPNTNTNTNTRENRIFGRSRGFAKFCTGMLK